MENSSDLFFGWLGIGIISALIIAAFFMVGRLIWTAIIYTREYKREYKKLLQQPKEENRENHLTL